MKKVVLLGSTGPIGPSTVMVAEDLPEQIQLVGLAAGGNSDLLFNGFSNWALRSRATITVAFWLVFLAAWR